MHPQEFNIERAGSFGAPDMSMLGTHSGTLIPVRAAASLRMRPGCGPDCGSKPIFLHRLSDKITGKPPKPPTPQPRGRSGDRPQRTAPPFLRNGPARTAPGSELLQPRAVLYLFPVDWEQFTSAQTFNPRASR